MKHAISYGARHYPWPSTQAASEMLAARCALGLRLKMTREALAPFMARYESRAAA